MNNYRVFAALVCAAMLAGCGDNAVQVITGPLPSSRIKFFNFGVSAPGVHFYANTAKMAAISSATGVEAVTGTTSGGVASGGLYSGIAPGTYALTSKIAAVIDKDLTITTVNATIADGKFYSFYVSGLYDAVAKTADGFVVEDPLPAAFDYSVAYVRFVNAIPNASAMTLYAKNTTTTTEVAVGTAVAYKGAGAFTSLPAGVYDLGTRLAGVATNAISRTAVSFNAGKVYTIGARGDITVTSTTAATRPQLDNTANR